MTGSNVTTFESKKSLNRQKHNEDLIYMIYSKLGLMFKIFMKKNTSYAFQIRKTNYCDTKCKESSNG